MSYTFSLPNFPINLRIHISQIHQLTSPLISKMSSAGTVETTRPPKVGYFEYFQLSVCIINDYPLFDDDTAGHLVSALHPRLALSWRWRGRVSVALLPTLGPPSLPLGNGWASYWTMPKARTTAPCRGSATSPVRKITGYLSDSPRLVAYVWCKH